MFASARRLHIIIVEARPEVGGQGAADDDDPRAQAVVTAMQNVPYEHGSGQGGQQAGSDVYVARVRQLRVRTNAIERHQANHQHKT